MCDCGTCCTACGHYDDCTSQQNTAPDHDYDPTDDYEL